MEKRKFLYELYKIIDELIKLFIFGGRSLESILDIDGISKLIISKEISVPVVDIASCRHNIPYLLLLQHEIIQIVLTVYYLKHKTSV